MLVVLRENVENLGRIGDVVKVKEGYARNFLLPRKLVAAADESNVKAIEAQKKSLEKKRQAQKAGAQEIAQKIENQSFTLSRKVGENDKLFGSVTAQDVVAAVKAGGFSIERRMIVLTKPIKALGVHPVVVRIEPDVEANIKVWVVKEA